MIELFLVLWFDSLGQRIGANRPVFVGSSNGRTARAVPLRTPHKVMFTIFVETNQHQKMP
jgi:hypothetical protein